VSSVFESFGPSLLTVKSKAEASISSFLEDLSKADFLSSFADTSAFLTSFAVSVFGSSVYVASSEAFSSGDASVLVSDKSVLFSYDDPLVSTLSFF